MADAEEVTDTEAPAIDVPIDPPPPPPSIGSEVERRLAAMEDTLATIVAILEPVRSAPTAALQPVHEAAAREGNRSGGLPQPVEPVENQEACAGPAAILRSLAGGGGALLGASGVPLVSREEFEGKPGTDPAGRYPSSSRHYRHVSYAGSFDFLADIPEPACIAYRSILGYREPLAGQLASRSDLMGYWQSCLGHLFRLLHAPQLSGVDAATQDARVRVVTVLVRIRFLFGIADTLLGWEGDDQQSTPTWAEVFVYLQQVRRLELHNQDFSPTDQLLVQLVPAQLAAVEAGQAPSFTDALQARVRSAAAARAATYGYRTTSSRAEAAPA